MIFLKRLGAAFIGFVAIVTFLSIVFTAAYYATTWLFAQLYYTPSPLIQQLLTSIFGLLIVLITVGTIGFINHGRMEVWQDGLFGSIVDALGRIAQGDYSVRLDNPRMNGGGGKPVGMLVQSVNTLAQELNAMETMRQEFISNVSHEIQSPLTSIRGFAHALHDDNLDAADRAHYLNIIETESTRLSKLTENLLALASLDSESYTLDPKPYRLDVQLRDIVLACEPQWQAKQIEMNLASEPVTLAGDQDLLNQVWLNLIHNSIKFTPARGKICMALHTRDNAIEFCITDTGSGIAPADQARIFERFYKADASRERARGGSGLGLAIAKKIVEMHHGTIAVQSALGAGSTFTVSLPNQPN